MKICIENHEEIIHNEVHCPLCTANDMVQDLTEQVKNLKELMEDQDNEIKLANKLLEG